MAVDAHHLLLSPPQLFSNRDLMMMNNDTTMELTNTTTFQNCYDGVSPFSMTDDSPPLLHHMYGVSSSYLDSDLITRKRSRDSTSTYYHHHHYPNPRSSSCVVTPTVSTSPFSFLGQDIDISSHLNQHHHDIDRFVSLHMERVKLEIQEKRKRQARTIIEAIEHGLVKRLRVKEQEKERIGKINHALEERVKSLSVENQIWRDLAHTNEATANNLRNNLDQVLAQVNELRSGGAGLDDDDAQSCCGSSSGDEEKTVVRMRTIAADAHDNKRMCRNCGEEESCVLLLPCRHLCLCGLCGSTVHTCPICTSPKNASVHVNMSP